MKPERWLPGYARQVLDADREIFSSDRAAEWGYGSEGRVTIPVCDGDAFATYFLACLQSEEGKYSSIFRSIRPVGP